MCMHACVCVCVCVCACVRVRARRKYETNGKRSIGNKYLYSIRSREVSEDILPTTCTCPSKQEATPPARPQTVLSLGNEGSAESRAASMLNAAAGFFWSHTRERGMATGETCLDHNIARL